MDLLISNLMSGMVLMLIATLFQIGGFSSPNEVLGAFFVFTILFYLVFLGARLSF